MQGLAGGGPFRDSFAYQSGRTLGGLGIICTFCCICGIITLLVAYFVWAIVTIATTAEVSVTACGGKYDIWTFCLTVMIIIPVLGCITSLIAALSKTPGLQAIPPLINLALAVWGVALWSNMSNGCRGFFDAEFPELLLLFHINVVLLAFSLLIFGCVICLGFAFLGGAVATGGFLGRMGYDAGGSSGGKDEELRNAAADGLEGEVERLLREDANVNGRGNRGWTALHHAAANGHVPTAQTLINAGAQIDAESDDGETPLLLALGKGDIESFLRSCGARETSPTTAAAKGDAPGEVV